MSLHPSQQGDPPSGCSLRLYVAGKSPRSLAAIANLRELIDAGRCGACDLEVVDIQALPHRADRDAIVVAPTLIRCDISPPLRVVGDLSDAQQVLRSLGLPSGPTATAP